MVVQMAATPRPTARTFRSHRSKLMIPKISQKWKQILSGLPFIDEQIPVSETGSSTVMSKDFSHFCEIHHKTDPNLSIIIIGPNHQNNFKGKQGVYPPWKDIYILHTQINTRQLFYHLDANPPNCGSTMIHHPHYMGSLAYIYTNLLEMIYV